MPERKNTVAIVIKVEDKASKPLKDVNQSLGGVGSAFSSVKQIAAGMLISNIALGSVQRLISLAGDAAGALITLGQESVWSAARASEMAGVNELLGEKVGLTAEQVRDATQAIVDQGIQTDVAQKTVAEFIRNEWDLGKAVDVARVAQDAAVISGQNSSDTMSQLIHGIATYNPLVLRNAGIVTSLDEATKNFGGSLGSVTTTTIDHTAAIDSQNQSLGFLEREYELLGGKVQSAQDDLTIANATMQEAPHLIANFEDKLVRAQLALDKKGVAIDKVKGKLGDLSSEHGTVSESTGNLTGNLTGAQKQFVMLNQVIDKGGTVAGAYDRAMEEPAKMIRSMPRYLYEWRREMGTHLLKAFRSWVDLLILGVKWLRAMTQEGKPVQRIMKAMGRIFDSFLSVIAGGATGGAFEGFEKVLSKIADVLEEVATWVATIFGGESVFAGGISGAGLSGAIQGPIDKLLEMLMGAAGILAGGFWTWITGPDGVIATAWDVMGNVIDKIGTWIDEKGPKIAEKIIDWVGAFWAWITDPEDGVLVKIGTVLGDVITDIAKWIVDNAPTVFEKMAEWVDAFWNWATGEGEGTVGGTMAGNLGTIITKLSKWISDNGPLIASAFLGFATAFWNWILEAIARTAEAMTTLTANLLLWVTGADGKEKTGGIGFAIGFFIADGIKGLFEKRETGDTIIGSLLLSLIQSTSNMRDILQEVGIEIGKGIVDGAVFAMTGQELTDKGSEALAAFVKFATARSGPLWKQDFKNQLGGDLMDAIGELGEEGMFQEAIAKTYEKFSSAFAQGPGGTGIRKEDNVGWKWADDAVTGVTDRVGEATKNELPTAFMGMAQVGIIDPVAETLKTGSRSEVFYQFGQDIDRGLIDGMEALLATVIAKAEALVAAIKKPFEDEDWKKLGKDIIQGIIDGIESKAAALARAAVKAARDALNAAKQEVESESPSRAFMRLGQSMMEGMAQGIAESAQLPIATSAAATGAVYNTSREMNLSIHTNAPVENIIDDFRLMESMV